MMNDQTTKVRVLQVHNSYAPGWGGEDTVVELERRLLAERGHVVDQFRASHASLKNASRLRQLLAAPGFLWSQRSYRALAQRIDQFSPDVIHVHNTFPQLSPSVLWAAHRAGVPVVQTLHNFRYLCVNALLLRAGRPCEECVGQPPWRALRYRCYAGSRARTAAVAAVNLLHSKLGTYGLVDAYIVLNEFSRLIFRRAHFPDDHLFRKPNFVLGSDLGRTPRREQAVFVGTISQAKGLPLLLEAWALAAPQKSTLLLIGDGPERASLERQYAQLTNVEWGGKLDRHEVLPQIAASRFLVFPSLAYEGCPMAVLEALSVGTPVIASDYPSMKAMIRHQGEGLLFRAGSAEALASALQTALLCPSETWSSWSNAARQTHTERYSDAVNYTQLISIYETAIAASSARNRIRLKRIPELSENF